ncbi:MAG: GNAT family N-acetyltransferase [Gammaproteobacteria bacterium]|nr:GNAT family N-acetyltransferase [Gammaproteobacteria bacterium]
MKPLCSDFPMPITTDRLIIRPVQVGDGAIFNEAILESFSELHQFMDWAKEKPSLAESEEIITLAAENWTLKKNDEPYLQLVILDKASKQFIGATGYHHYNWDIPSVETGYWIRTSESGKGLMTEAINAITQYAFKQLKVKRIAITCDPDNIKSKNIPERLGYTLEGRLKHNRIKSGNGGIGDTLIYAKYDLTDLPSLNVSW